MNAPRLALVSWAAWAPSLSTREAWQAYLQTGGPLATVDNVQPACATVPAMIRRRCGQNSRMVLETSEQACVAAGVDAASVQVVLGSPNGENHALKALLEDLCQSAPLSPTAFTNSLHHVPTGYFSIVRNNRQISRTISAFEDTFAWAWLDTQAMLARRPDRPVLLTITDEIPPEPFEQMLIVPEFPYAVSMVLRVAASDEPALSFEFSHGENISPRLHRELPFDFLKWYDGAAPVFTATTTSGAITWRKH